jgi:hypothetical protein
MSAELHKFAEDLKQRPLKGSNAPPVGIRAKDLDENFAKVRLIESDKANPKPYEVVYTKDGTRIENIRAVPDGEHDGDILFWKDSERKWKVFPAVRNRDKLHVLGILDGKLGWIKTEDC